MKLSNSEILLLVQALFLLKNNSSFLDWKTSEKIDSLHKKLSEHFASFQEDSSQENDFILKHMPCLDNHEQECGLSEDEFIENEEGPYDQEISMKDMLVLESIKVVDKNVEKTMRFSDGGRGMVDITLDDGNEIVCDVTRILRNESEIHCYTAEGWKVFEVIDFSKSWSALLACDEINKPKVVA